MRRLGILIGWDFDRESEELDRELEDMFPNAHPSLVGSTSSATELREKLYLPVSVLDLSVRVENRLIAANIQTLGDLVRRTEADMLRLDFGEASMRDIKKKLGDMGLTFGME